MSSKSAPPLALALKPSRRLLGAVGGCYALAAAASLANALPWEWRGLMLILVLAGARLSRHGLTGRISMKAALPGCNPITIARLRVDGADAWQLWTLAGQEIPVTLLPGSINLPWLILLHFRGDDGRFYAVPILPDSLGAHDFRRLAVRLRNVKFSARKSLV
ncbi:MAG: hypothetical protein EPN21_04150 [Methylococcaceae bacterium]|nr:MAG: hypothetical protein EPN21_04150 [Methylococcaceae bacterium]